MDKITGYACKLIGSFQGGHLLATHPKGKLASPVHLWTFSIVCDLRSRDPKNKSADWLAGF